MTEYRRILTPDLLKGLAVLFMIQVHIMELFVRQEIADGPAGILSLFLGGVPAAPVFMVVMGYFLAFRRKSPQQMISRGIKLFLAGILLNIGLNAHLIYRVVFDGWGATVNIWNYIFGVDILHLAGLSLLVTGAFTGLFRKRFIPSALLLVLVFFVPWLFKPGAGEQGIADYFLAFFYSTAPWSYFPVVPWLAYPLAGYLFFTLEEKYNQLINNRFKWIILIILTAFLAFTLDYGTGIMHDLPRYYHHGFPFFFWAVLFVGWWSILVSLAAHYFRDSYPVRYIRWLGAHVTTVYVFQWLIIGNMATAVYKTQPLHTAVIWFAVILIFTSLFTFGWNKIKKRYSLNILSL